MFAFCLGFRFKVLKPHGMSVLRRGIQEDLRSVDGSRLTLEETLTSVEIPPGRLLNTPRVEHFLASKTGSILHVVSHQLQLPESFVAELIRFGAVYSCPVVPTTSPNEPCLSATSQQELMEIRAAARFRHGRNPRFQRPFRVHHSTVVEKDAYIRVHVHPKRFPAFYKHNWKDRIVFENENCIVVNKPPGCQVPSRVDNSLECLTKWIQDFLQLEMELKPVHRLDTGTEGLVFLAKTKEFAQYFQKLLLGSEGGTRYLKKWYRALTLEKPPLGNYSHYIKSSKIAGRPPRSVICGEGEGGAYAEMEVLDSEQIQLSDSSKSQWKQDYAFESCIELRTGRTHQIRVQLAHEGFPILGDGLYQSEVLFSEDGCIGLQAKTVEIFDPNLHLMFSNCATNSISFNAGDAWWSLPLPQRLS